MFQDMGFEQGASPMKKKASTEFLEVLNKFFPEDTSPSPSYLIHGLHTRVNVVVCYLFCFGF
jgi:hypothetical protein